MQISTAFDSGSIGSHAIDDGQDEIELTVATDGLNYRYWTHFSVSGVLGRTVTFRITNASAVPFLSEPGQTAQMVYSYDGQLWQRLTDHGYGGGVYWFQQTFTSDDVRIATFFPYTVGDASDLVDQSALGPWATKNVLGSSHQGRDVTRLTITNPLAPDSEKRIVYIVGRQHAAETASSHMLEGLIEFLISDAPEALALRDGFVWHIVPMANPDGVFIGNSRANAQGNDPNRDWHQNNHDSVEIDQVRSDLDSVDSTDGIDLFIDWHSQMSDTSWYNFVYSPPGNDFFPVLSQWTDFDVERAVGTSCSVSSCSARGYATGRGLSVFVMEPTPHLAGWTRSSLRAEGVDVALAVDDYFAWQPASPAGSVGSSLVLDRWNTTGLTASWGPSCLAEDADYAVYEGELGDFSSHRPTLAPFCTTNGAVTLDFLPRAGSRYYLVVPQGPSAEGSYGSRSSGLPRGRGASSCRVQLWGSCP